MGDIFGRRWAVYYINHGIAGNINSDPGSHIDRDMGGEIGRGEVGSDTDYDIGGNIDRDIACGIGSGGVGSNIDRDIGCRIFGKGWAAIVTVQRYQSLYICQ